MFVTHGPARSTHVIILAPGDQGQLTDPAPTHIARRLGAAGLRVVRFGFPQCDVQDARVRDAVLADQIRDAVAKFGPADSEHLVLGGLSRGARVSVGMAEELAARAVLGFAYPFHPRHDPDPGTRAVELALAPVPALICQGTRDTHGNRQQVQGYGLPPHVRVHWIPDATHALRPRLRSGLTQAEVLDEAVRAVVAFLQDPANPNG